MYYRGKRMDEGFRHDRKCRRLPKAPSPSPPRRRIPLHIYVSPRLRSALPKLPNAECLAPTPFGIAETAEASPRWDVSTRLCSALPKLPNAGARSRQATYEWLFICSCVQVCRCWIACNRLYNVDNWPGLACNRLYCVYAGGRGPGAAPVQGRRGHKQNFLRRNFLQHSLLQHAICPRATRCDTPRT
jgi:hypothetical protein